MRPDLPLFSVVIPAYNAANWLGLTLDSWASQTRSDFEVIVVDDGSSDRTVAVAETFHDRLDLRVIREPHSGAPARPCNVGIDAARGELIVHCDADDLAAPERLEWIERAWNAAGRRDCLLISDFAEVDQFGNTVRPSVLDAHSALAGSQFQRLADNIALLSAEEGFSALLEGSFIRPCSAATPKRMLTEIGGFDESLRNAQDYDLFLRIAHDYPIALCRRVLAYYRNTPGNISSRLPSELAASKFAIFRRLLSSPVSRQQKTAIRRWMSANYDALGYEYGERRELFRSISAYSQALRYDAQWTHARGVIASLAKWTMRGQRSHT